MPEHKYSYTVPFKIRSYEVDQRQEVTISTICNYFQEAAGLHARELRFDISDLHKEGLTWILYKLQVNVSMFPKRWESVLVTTWPSAGNGIRAYRDYKLHDDTGELLAAGLSQWMILDIKRKKPAKIPDKLMNKRFKTGEHVMELHTQSLPKTGGENAEFFATAGLNDLDMNGHVNNVRYIDWITGYNRSDILKRKKCREIIIQYASETKAGDNIYLAGETVGKTENEVLFTLYKNGTKNIIANAKTVWL